MLEILMASFTLGLVLTMVAMLIHQYLRVMKQGDESLLRLAPRLALVNLCEETRLALEITTAQTGLLTLERIRPASLPLVGADPWPLSRQMTVSYQLEQQELWRVWQWPGQPRQRELIAAPVKQFSARRLQEKVVLIQLDSLEQKVWLWHD